MNVLKKSPLRRISSLLPKKHTKWFAAAEQVGISGNNFLFSILIVKFGGIEILGEFNFWFVVCQFLSILAVGLCIRQMVLMIADATLKKQRSVLAANCWIVFHFQILQTCALIFIVWLKPPGESPELFVMSVIAYTASLNASELLRQFLYMRGRQRLSFVYTGVALSTSFLLFVVLVVSGSTDQPGQIAFWMQALGQGLYVVIVISVTPLFFRRMNEARSIRADVQKAQLEQGMPLLGGMIVTWLQNKSISPILMFTMGPLITGYFALANMIMSPANMILSGLSKNALPQLRRAYGNGDVPQLMVAINAQSRTSFLVIAIYLVVTVLVLVGGTTLGYFKVENNVAMMLFLVVFTLVLSNYRFWTSQHYVVQMKFEFMFRIGVIAAAVTVSIMLFSGLVLKSAVFVVAASAIGELCLLYLIRRDLKASVPAV